MYVQKQASPMDYTSSASISIINKILRRHELVVAVDKFPN